MSSPLLGPYQDLPDREKGTHYLNSTKQKDSHPTGKTGNHSVSLTTVQSSYNFSQSCFGPGLDGDSLLCSESLTSTPPSEDSLKSSQETKSPACSLHYDSQKHRVVENEGVLSITDSLVATDKTDFSSSSSVKVYTSSLSGSAITKTTSVLQDRLPYSPLIEKGNERQLDRRMNTNGYDRSRLTGPNPPTSDNPSWLTDAANPSHAHTRPVEGMLAPRLISGQEGHLVLSSGSQGSIAPGAASIGSLFRPPITLYPNVGQYSPSPYTTCTSGPLYSSSMYTLHGQPTHLASVSPYNPLYTQLAAAAASNYGHSSLLPSNYPRIESYSAVLAHMGNHVQQTQLPRSPYLTGHIPQFPALSPATVASGSTHAHMTSTNSPDSNVSHLMGHQDLLKHEAINKAKACDYEMRGRLTSAPLPSREPKLVTRPPHSPLSQGKSSKLRDNVKLEVGGKDQLYKGVPCGKEGSLKHRILTRPPDIQIEGSALTDSKAIMPTRIKTEVPSPKRTKVSSSVSHVGPVSEVGSGDVSNTTGSQQSSSQPHYPLHFMKGSVIELANGSYKRVEDLQTEDFVNSADFSNDLKIDSSTVVRIQENFDRGTAVLSFSVGEHKLQVTVEATLEHPFFVFGQGWSSFSPDKSAQRYGLDCQKLTVGDVCISLTHKDVTSQAAQLKVEASETRRKSRGGVGSVRFTTPSRMPPPSNMSRGLSLEEGQRQMSMKDKESNRSDKDQKGHPEVRSSLLEGFNPEEVPPRKRRWSAPDQVSVETDTPPPSKKSAENKDNKPPTSEGTGGTKT